MLEGFFEQTNKYIFERTTKRTFLNLYLVHFVCSINVHSKFNYFERTLIRKNKKNKKNSKERNSKEQKWISNEHFSIKRPGPVLSTPSWPETVSHDCFLKLLQFCGSAEPERLLRVLLWFWFWPRVNHQWRIYDSNNSSCNWWQLDFCIPILS